MLLMNRRKTNISYYSWRKSERCMLQSRAINGCLGDMEDSILETSVVFKT